MTETRDDVLKQYAKWFNVGGSGEFRSCDSEAMADEIVKLRAQLAGVRERVEKVQRYVPVEGFAGRAEMEKCDWGIWCELDDVLAALDGAA